MAAVRITDWQQTHPEYRVVPSDGKWLLVKPCVKQAKRFESYFEAQRLCADHSKCGCSIYHEIVELALDNPPPVRKSPKEIGYSD